MQASDQTSNLSSNKSSNRVSSQISTKRSKKIHPRDAEILRQFQKWLEEQRSLKKITYQEGADRVNATCGEDEISWTKDTLRMIIHRKQSQSGITRPTCRRVALALDLDVDEVLLRAGFLPDSLSTAHLSDLLHLITLRLPPDILALYAQLDNDQQATLHEQIRQIHSMRQDS